MRGRSAGRVLHLVVLVLGTAGVALALLTVVESLFAGSPAAGFPVAARALFFFADIAFYVWIPFLVVTAIRSRRRPRPLAAILAALAGGVVNVLVVALIGVVQEGRLASFVALAVEGSAAFVLAAALVVPLLERLLPAPVVKPPSDGATRP